MRQHVQLKGALPRSRVWVAMRCIQQTLRISVSLNDRLSGKPVSLLLASSLGTQLSW